MTYHEMSKQEWGRTASEFYQTRIRPHVETEENIGKMLILDVVTGDYEIDDMNNSLAMNKRMLAKHPGSRLAGFRIGYDAVQAFGGYASPAKQTLMMTGTISNRRAYISDALSQCSRARDCRIHH